LGVARAAIRGGSPASCASRRPMPSHDPEDVRERHREIVPIDRGTAPPRPEQPKPVGESLIEWSTEKQEDPNELVVFGDSPSHCSCPHCERTVVTFIDYEASWVTYVLGFVVWFSLGWMALWILPLLWPAFKDVVHHCPRCLNVVARKSRISLPDFKNEVMTLKVGSCAVVLARKYVVILAGLVITIVTVAILRSTVHIAPGQASRDTMPRGEPSMLTWEDFLHECGPRTSLGHRTSATRNFEEHFRKRSFKWQAEVLLIREGFDVFFLHAKSVVMVRMYPARYPRHDVPDIALLFSDDKNPEVAPLNKGDWIEFDATMTAHGHRGDPEVMSLWHIKQVPKPSVLSSSAAQSDQLPVREAPAPPPPVREPLSHPDPPPARPEPPAPTPAPPAATPAPAPAATPAPATELPAAVVDAGATVAAKSPKADAGIAKAEGSTGEAAVS